ncbi:hypothetical protein N7509_007934 [Penicillium cosmopolitanum]|uniref:Uncharacterized protein n=1 Tax=Penicillium cosmopolitanum TaxID=1131564 RepID=A0A9W9VZY3_9EURO|nr:uncharacterized protein N7509_007934 [Penicillium cosmopolitanum]KAJ5392444.1 hypothetical protein N7509_007934 [Penicillium cosmopolitanum]
MQFFKPFLLGFLCVVEITAAPVSKHDMLMNCMNKELDNLNNEYQLSPDNMGKLKRVMDKKIMQLSFDKPMETEHRKRPGAASMARKAMPGVPPETIDKIMGSLAKSSMHCANVLQ